MTDHQAVEESPVVRVPSKNKIKLVVWDLDNTLWDGVLLEDGEVRLRKDARETLAIMDQRGILLSIASKNDYETAMNKLAALGLQEYFLYPQIHWNPKSSSIREIVKSVNIGMDTVAFIDDDPFEREEVKHALPEVTIYDAAELSFLVAREELLPQFITEDSARRREMYRADIQRKRIEDEFIGSNEEFLASLNMRFTIAVAQESDLQRAEELTIRTNQLNTTGYTYSYDELNTIRQSPDHLLLIAGLDDRFGTYGKIGLVLIEKSPDIWTIKLLLMSCRVMSRGVGTLLINHILMLAHDAGVRLQSEFQNNGRNRMMLVTYKFNGFRQINQSANVMLLEHDLQQIQSHPQWIDVCIPA